MEGWNLTKVATAVVKQPDFNRTRTLIVLQATEEVKFKVSTSKTDTSSETTADSLTAGFEVGVESTTEVGGTVGVAEAKESVNIGAKSTVSVTNSSEKTKEIANGKVEEVEFKGKKIADSAPSIKPA